MFHALVSRFLERTLFVTIFIFQRRGASDKHVINNCQSFTDKISQFISPLLLDSVNVWKLSRFAVIIFNKFGEMWITGQKSVIGMISLHHLDNVGASVGIGTITKLLLPRKHYGPIIYYSPLIQISVYIFRNPF